MKREAGVQTKKARAIVASAKACPPNISFARDILPLFRPIDVDHMKHVTANKLDLSDYQSTKIWSQEILNRLQDQSMPPTPAAPWTPANINLFACWIQQGMQP